MLYDIYDTIKSNISIPTYTQYSKISLNVFYQSRIQIYICLFICLL